MSVSNVKKNVLRMDCIMWILVLINWLEENLSGNRDFLNDIARTRKRYNAARNECVLYPVDNAMKEYHTLCKIDEITRRDEMRNRILRIKFLNLKLRTRNLFLLPFENLKKIFKALQSCLDEGHAIFDRSKNNFYVYKKSLNYWRLYRDNLPATLRCTSR